MSLLSPGVSKEMRVPGGRVQRCPGTPATSTHDDLHEMASQLGRSDTALLSIHMENVPGHRCTLPPGTLKKNCYIGNHPSGLPSRYHPSISRRW